MTQVNYKSDFMLALTFCVDGIPAGLPDNDFEIRFYTANIRDQFRCGRKANNYTHCQRDGDRLLVFMDNHHLASGKLKAEVIDLLADDRFDDGIRKVVTPQVLDLELVDGMSDTGAMVELEIEDRALVATIVTDLVLDYCNHQNLTTFFLDRLNFYYEGWESVAPDKAAVNSIMQWFGELEAMDQSSGRLESVRMTRALYKAINTIGTEYDENGDGSFYIVNKSDQV